MLQSLVEWARATWEYGERTSCDTTSGFQSPGSCVIARKRCHIDQYTISGSNRTNVLSLWATQFHFRFRRYRRSCIRRHLQTTPITQSVSTNSVHKITENTRNRQVQQVSQPFQLLIMNCTKMLSLYSSQSIYKSSLHRCLTGMRLVEDAFCQPAETYQTAVTERRRRTVYSSVLHHRRCFTDRRTVKWYFCNISHKQIIALSLFYTRRHRVARSANYPGHGPGSRSLQRNVIRRATDQSLVQRVAGRLSVLFILRIPLSLTSLLTDVHSGVTMRKSVKYSFFVNNFQTLSVVYKDVLSWLWYFCMSLSISLDVWRIFLCVYYINAYVNEYTVACKEWNSVACNTTRRHPFCFMCIN